MPRVLQLLSELNSLTWVKEDWIAFFPHRAGAYTLFGQNLVCQGSLLFSQRTAAYYTGTVFRISDDAITSLTFVSAVGTVMSRIY